MSLTQEARGDLGREEDHRKAGARMSAAPDQPDAVDFLKFVLWATVEHLIETVGQIESGPMVDPLVGPVGGGHHFLGADP